MLTNFPARVDDALVMDADYEFDDLDRRKVDEQIRAIQSTVLDTSLSGKSATYFDLASTSAAVVAGDVVCAAAISGFPSYVTKAVAAALTAAGAPLGVVLAPASPGSKVLVAVSGLIAASVTGLSASAGQITVNPTTARAQRVAGSYPLGYADSQGTLTLAPGSGNGAGLHLTPAEGVTVAAGAGTVDATIYTVPSSPSGVARAFLSALIGRLSIALVGSGSVAISAGITAGGTTLWLSKTITNATAVGNITGKALAELGSGLAAADGYTATLDAGAIISIRTVATGTITTYPAWQVRALGAPL